MRTRADDIRKRMAKRRREKERGAALLPETEELYGFEKFPSYESVKEGGNQHHPLFRKEIFLFKILASACLVLIVAIVVRSGSERAEPVAQLIEKTMETEFQFAAVSGWYEERFGKPLALLPLKTESEEKEPMKTDWQYALPASGKILEDFGDNGERITIETGNGSAVEAIDKGLVLFVGQKEGFGRTIIIQHGDKSETWYGNLDSLDVSVYEYIEAGTRLGTASAAADGEKGMFYFAVRKGDDFIDPIEVIKFE